MSNPKKLSTASWLTVSLTVTLGSLAPFHTLDITWQTSFRHTTRMIHLVRSSVIPDLTRPEKRMSRVISGQSPSMAGENREDDSLQMERYPAVVVEKSEPDRGWKRPGL